MLFRLLRRFAASGVAACLLVAAPGLPCYEAAAQVVQTGSPSSSMGGMTQSGAAGAAALGRQAGVSGLPTMDFRLNTGLALPSVSAPVTVSGGVRVMEAVAGVELGRSPVSAPDSAGPPTVTAAPAALTETRARLTAGVNAAGGFEQGPSVQDKAEAIEGVRVSAGSLFGETAWKGQAPGTPEALDQRSGAGFQGRPLAVRPVSGLGRLVKSVASAAGKLRESLDLSDHSAPPEPMVPEAPLTGRDKAVAAARKGFAGALASGFGVGSVFAGAAVAAASALWSPVFAVVAGALGAGALGLAVKQRLSQAGRKPSWSAAVMAGGGLLLLGASAAPALTAAVGAAVLHAFAIGLIVGLALLFEFLNGMHDASNSIATIVATKTLTPRQAVLWAAFFNSIAYFFFGAHIATTIGSGLIAPAVMSNALLVAALLGASLWNWITVRLGIPVSSSHALIGGLVGAAVVAGGFEALMPAALVKTGLFMVVSPVAGLAAAFALMGLVMVFFKGPLSAKSNRLFGGFQLFSSALLSLGHGGNDSQKTIGIITALLFANGYLGAVFHVPWPVAVASYAAMGLGTLSGGWRVIRTLGEKVASLDRAMGTAAEVGAGAAIMLSTWLGIPVSTTHVVTGAVTGVGAARGGASSVKWATLRKIALAWVLTIPFAALMSGLLYLLFTLLV